MRLREARRLSRMEGLNGDENQERREREREWDETQRILLLQTLESEGWKEVIVPLLMDKLNALRSQFETNTKLGIEEIRGLQGQAALLRQILQEPRKFFAVTETRQEDEDR